MRFLKSAFLAILLILTFSIQVFAEKREVPANKSSVVLYSVVYDPETCGSQGRPQTKINQGAAHGNIRFEWFAYKMGKSAYHCNGKPAHGMLVIYTPDKGYRGPDSIKFSLIGSGGPGPGYSISKTYRYDLTVK